MRLFRTVLVVMLAFSVATLPAIGGFALAPSAHASTQDAAHHHDASATAVRADSTAKHCDKEPSRGCDCDAACLLKCMMSVGTLAPSSAVLLPVSFPVAFAVLDESGHSNGSHPPLPPPRL